MYTEYKKSFGYGVRYPYTQYFINAGLAGRQHIGVDYLMPVGTPLYAPADGVVQFRQSNTVGNEVDFYCNDGSLTRYLHCSEYAVPEGPVKKGQLMAYSGNTGVSTAPHVHIDCWPGGSYTGKIEDTIDPERFWDKPILVTVLYTKEGKKKDELKTEVEKMRKLLRPYVHMEITYKLVEPRTLRKTESGKYFNEYDVQMNYIPYANKQDVCILFTEELDSSTGLYGYYTRDLVLGLRFIAIRLNYNTTRSQNDPSLGTKKMMPGVFVHEVAHAFAHMVGYKWQGNDDYDELMPGYDNTHHFDYVVNDLLEYCKTFDTRKMKRNRHDLMFRYNVGGTRKSDPTQYAQYARVYRDWGNTIYLQYTDKWEKITEEDYKKAKAKGAASMILSDAQIRWIVANTNVEHTFDIIGIRATTKGSAGRQLMLKTLGWSEDIPITHLTEK